MKQDESTIWLLYGEFMAISKGFIYLSDSLPIAIKAILATYKFRHQILEDKVSVNCWNLVQKIRNSIRFYNKNIHNNKSLIDVFANFLEKEDTSSDDEQEERKKEIYLKVNFFLKKNSKKQNFFKKNYKIWNFPNFHKNFNFRMNQKKSNIFVNFFTIPTSWRNLSVNRDISTTKTTKIFCIYFCRNAKI